MGKKDKEIKEEKKERRPVWAKNTVRKRKIYKQGEPVEDLSAEEINDLKRRGYIK
jgi:hypothetical protein